MTAADLAAYIGAAAWLPQIATWVYEGLSKPKLTIVSARKIEIGFTMFGPIVNATLAVSSERRDALIEKISLNIKHQHGERRTLVWRFINENQQQIRDPQGNISSQFKNNPAVALKVSTLALTERIVGFHDPDFEDADRVASSRIAEQFRHLDSQIGNAAALEQLLGSMEFQQLHRDFGNFMYWRAGQYEFEMSAQLAGSKEPQIQRFQVTFTDSDIESLRKNVDLLIPYVRATFSDDPADRMLITWNWAYPVINSLS